LQWFGIAETPDEIAGLSFGPVEVQTQVLSLASNTEMGAQTQ